MNITNKVIDKIKLSNSRPGLKISICIPTHPSSHGSNTKVDMTRFKNALKSISGEIDSSLQATYKKLDKLSQDKDFWLHQSKSLLVLADSNNYEVYKLPFETTEAAIVDQNYLLSPAIISNSLELDGYLFKFSLNQAQLYQADANDLLAISDLGIKSMSELLQADHQVNRQQHSTSGTKATAHFHGHGGSKDLKEEDINFYTTYVAGILDKFLSGSSAPLILFGDEARLVELKHKLHYHNVIDENIAGSAKELDKVELTKKVNQILIESALAKIKTKAEELHQAVTGSKVLNSVAKIMSDIERGAVARLYVEAIRQTNDSVRDSLASDYLIELPDKGNIKDLIRKTLEQGGEIVPLVKGSLGGNGLAAMLRY